MGWTSAGSPMPDTSNLVPSRALKTTLIANFVNLGFFGIGCKFFTETFIDMYVGVVAASTRDRPAVEAIYLIMSNAGMCMLMNIVSALMVLAAEPGNADTNYRIQRAWLYTNFVYLGMLSRERRRRRHWLAITNVGRNLRAVLRRDLLRPPRSGAPDQGHQVHLSAARAFEYSFNDTKAHPAVRGEGPAKFHVIFQRSKLAFENSVIKGNPVQFRSNPDPPATSAL